MRRTGRLVMNWAQLEWCCWSQGKDFVCFRKEGDGLVERGINRCFDLILGGVLCEHEIDKKWVGTGRRT